MWYILYPPPPSFHIKTTPPRRIINTSHEEQVIPPSIANPYYLALKLMTYPLEHRHSSLNKLCNIFYNLTHELLSVS